MPTAKTKRGSATKSARRAGADSSSSDPRPLGGYAKLLTVYGVVAGALAVALRKQAPGLQQLDAMDLALYGLATEHLSRLITKDSVTSVLRAPFTEFKEAAGEGEVNEDVVGHGTRHAIGELLTCPFCSAQWVATALVAGRVAAPNLTRAIVSVSAAARLSDYLQLLYAFCREHVDS
ncbi:MAG TPA: DUF1360 domain-containing protein [Acidimicrobiales bacterium]|nr:DUF1360 domain-containing protein [Acidimicrobiales bacterium]